MERTAKSSIYTLHVTLWGGQRKLQFTRYTSLYEEDRENFNLHVTRHSMDEEDCEKLNELKNTDTSDQSMVTVTTPRSVRGNLSLLWTALDSQSREPWFMRPTDVTRITLRGTALETWIAFGIWEWLDFALGLISTGYIVFHLSIASLAIVRICWRVGLRYSS